jgi:hypothetical protein
MSAKRNEHTSVIDFSLHQTFSIGGPIAGTAVNTVASLTDGETVKDEISPSQIDGSWPGLGRARKLRARAGLGL